MTLDMKKFMREKLEPRTESVPVPELKPWSADGKDPVFTVRGLTGAEVVQVRGAVDKNKNIEALVSTLVGANGQDAAAVVKELLGFGDTLPDDYVRRIEILLVGCVDPILDRQQAVRLATAFPFVVQTLTDKILLLTGLGHEPGKSKDSGKTRASATP